MTYTARKIISMEMIRGIKSISETTNIFVSFGLTIIHGFQK